MGARATPLFIFILAPLVLIGLATKGEALMLVGSEYDISRGILFLNFDQDTPTIEGVSYSSISFIATTMANYYGIHINSSTASDCRVDMSFPFISMALSSSSSWYLELSPIDRRLVYECVNPSSPSPNEGPKSLSIVLLKDTFQDASGSSFPDHDTTFELIPIDSTPFGECLCTLPYIEDNNNNISALEPFLGESLNETAAAILFNWVACLKACNFSDKEVVYTPPCADGQIKVENSDVCFPEAYCNKLQEILASNSVLRIGKFCPGMEIRTLSDLKLLYYCELIEGDIVIRDSDLISYELASALSLVREIRGSLVVANNSKLEDLQFLNRLFLVGSRNETSTIRIESNSNLRAMTHFLHQLELQSPLFKEETFIRDNPLLCIDDLGLTWANQHHSYIEFNKTQCPDSVCSYYEDKRTGLCSTMFPGGLHTCSVIRIIEQATLDFIIDRDCEVIVGDLILKDLPDTIDEDFLIDAMEHVEIITGSLVIEDNLYLTSLSFLHSLRSVQQISIGHNPSLVDARLPSIANESSLALKMDIDNNPRLHPQRHPFALTNSRCVDCPYIEVHYSMVYDLKTLSLLGIRITNDSLASGIFGIETRILKRFLAQENITLSKNASSIIMNGAKLIVDYILSPVQPGLLLVSRFIQFREGFSSSDYSALSLNDIFKDSMPNILNNGTEQQLFYALINVTEKGLFLSRPVYKPSAFGYNWRKDLRGVKEGNRFILSWDVVERNHVNYIRYRRVYAPPEMNFATTLLQELFPLMTLLQARKEINSMTDLMSQWVYVSHHDDVYRESYLEIIIDPQTFDIDEMYEFQLVSSDGTTPHESTTITMSPAEPSLLIPHSSVTQLDEQALSISWTSPEHIEVGCCDIIYEVSFYTSEPGSGHTHMSSIDQFESVPGKLVLEHVFDVYSLTISCWDASTSLWELEAVSGSGVEGDNATLSIAQGDPASVKCVQPFTYYGVRIRAIDVDEQIYGLSTTFLILTRELAPPTAPTMELVDRTETTLSLVINTEQVNVGLLRGFVLVYSSNNFTTSQDAVFSVDLRQSLDTVFYFTLAHLSPAKTYKMRLHSFTESQLLSPENDPYVFTTKEARPSQCEHIELNPIKSSRGSWLYNISWDPPLEPNGAIIQYEVITVNDTNAETWPVYNGSSLSTIVLPGNLLGFVRIRAFTSAGAGPYSIKVAVPAFPKETLPSNSGFDIITSVVIPVCAGFVFLIIMAFVYKRHVKRMKEAIKKDYETFMMPPDVAMYLEKLNGNGPKKELVEIQEERLELGDKLGEGKFGIVYKGMLKPADEDEKGKKDNSIYSKRKLMSGKRKKNQALKVPIAVAVKSVKFGAPMSEQGELQVEAAIMNLLSHPNVVQLLGVSKIKGRFMLVTEFCANGALIDFLHSNVNAIPPQNQLKMAVDVADAMFYLSSIGIIHRDLAARNVLVSLTLQCKVSDFGFSRSLDDGTYYTSTKNEIPVRWTAPEALDDRKYSTATDTWSFGILLYEIVTFGMKPYSDWTNQRVWIEVKGGYRLPRPENCTESVYDVMMKCWTERPDQRPTFHWIRTKLKHLAKEATDSDYTSGSETYSNCSIAPSEDYSRRANSPYGNRLALPHGPKNSSNVQGILKTSPDGKLSPPSPSSSTSTTTSPKGSSQLKSANYAKGPPMSNHRFDPDFIDSDRIKPNAELDLGMTDYADLVGKNDKVLIFSESFDPRGSSPSEKSVDLGSQSQSKTFTMDSLYGKRISVSVARKLSNLSKASRPSSCFMEKKSSFTGLHDHEADEGHPRWNKASQKRRLSLMEATKNRYEDTTLPPAQDHETTPRFKDNDDEENDGNETDNEFDDDYESNEVLKEAMIGKEEQRLNEEALLFSQHQRITLNEIIIPNEAPEPKIDLYQDFNNHQPQLSNRQRQNSSQHYPHHNNHHHHNLHHSHHGEAHPPDYRPSWIIVDIDNEDSRFQDEPRHHPHHYYHTRDLQPLAKKPLDSFIRNCDHEDDAHNNDEYTTMTEV